MPIFVCLGFLCRARLVNDRRRQGFDFRPLLRRGAEKSAAAVRRSLSASLRQSPRTMRPARARIHAALKCCFFAIASVLQAASMILEQGRCT